MHENEGRCPPLTQDDKGGVCTRGGPVTALLFLYSSDDHHTENGVAGPWVQHPPGLDAIVARGWAPGECKDFVVPFTRMGHARDSFGSYTPMRLGTTGAGNPSTFRYSLLPNASHWVRRAYTSSRIWDTI